MLREHARRERTSVSSVLRLVLALRLAAGSCCSMECALALEKCDGESVARRGGARPALTEMEIVDLSVGCCRLTLAVLRCAMVHLARWSQKSMESRWSLPELPCSAVSEHPRPECGMGDDEDP